MEQVADSIWNSATLHSKHLALKTAASPAPSSQYGQLEMTKLAVLKPQFWDISLSLEGYRPQKISENTTTKLLGKLI